MREFLLKMFQWEGGPEITLFSIWHIMYIVLIVGLTIGFAFIVKNKSEKVKKNVLNVLAVTAIAVYIADFFIMPLNGVGYGGYLDKLPFHICTFISIMIPFAQFSKSNNKIAQSFKEIVACLSIVASLMYMTYPGSAIGDIGTFSYKVVQTFVFHGLVFSWGFMSLATGSISLKIKNIWKQALGILFIIGWATLGNLSYGDYNWFFLVVPPFSFIPTQLTPLAIWVGVFAMCAIIYGIYYAVKAINNKIKAKKQ